MPTVDLPNSYIRERNRSQHTHACCGTRCCAFAECNSGTRNRRGETCHHSHRAGFAHSPTSHSSAVSNAHDNTASQAFSSHPGVPAVCVTTCAGASRSHGGPWRPANRSRPPAHHSRRASAPPGAPLALPATRCSERFATEVRCANRSFFFSRRGAGDHRWFETLVRTAAPGRRLLDGARRRAARAAALAQRGGAVRARPLARRVRRHGARARQRGLARRRFRRDARVRRRGRAGARVVAAAARDSGRAGGDGLHRPDGGAAVRVRRQGERGALPRADAPLHAVQPRAHRRRAPRAGGVVGRRRHRLDVLRAAANRRRARL